MAEDKPTVRITSPTAMAGADHTEIGPGAYRLNLSTLVEKAIVLLNGSESPWT
jgi:hypothetical protein